MRKLRDADIIRILREEWNLKRNRLAETVDVLMHGKVDGKEKKSLLSPDLKLRHKGTQFLYTVVSVGPNNVIIKNPEGQQMIIDKEILEKEYAID